MIAKAWANHLSEGADRLAIQTAARAYTYAQLSAQAEKLRSEFEPHSGETIGLAGGDLPARIAALLAMESCGITPCLFPQGMSESQQADWAVRLQLSQVFDAGSVSLDFAEKASGEKSWLTAQPASPEVWLFTSGTTGPPQPVKHRWERLAATVHQGGRYQHRRWMLGYDPSSFAGMQVWLQGLLTGGSVHDVAGDSQEVTAKRMKSEQIEFASGTSTFWRMLLAHFSAEHASLDFLQQITLGGEPVSDGTLIALKAAFPQARITHIYATTELGVCFQVTDGKAGFPKAYLSQPQEGCELRVSAEGELEVRSARCALDDESSLGEWRPTGDLVSVDADRVRFLGRKSEVILVGGSKVLPAEVESVIQSVLGVAEVRVSGQASSLLGAIVKAEVQPQPNTEEQTLRSAIVAACETELAAYKRPAMIEFTSELSLTPTGKLVRQSTSPDTRKVES